MKKKSNRIQACIYARVSTEEQKREGFSIPAQLRMLREYADRKGYKVAKEFQDNETAKSTGRVGFNDMLSYLGKNSQCTIILVEKTDRLTRNMQDYLALDIEKTGIEIHFVRDSKIMSRDSSPSEHFIQDIEIAQAAYISRNISSEAKKGMRAKAEAGLYPSKAPLGYRNTQDKTGVRIIVPDEETAPLVQLLFEEYASGGTSIDELSSILFDSGFRTARGNRISTSNIHHMLKNPIYRGDFIWKGVEYEGKHDPSMSSTLWYQVQDMLGERSVEKPKQKHQFAYIGLMKCGHCGYSITAERRKNRYSYYHCTGYKGRHGEPHIREEKLTEMFSSMLHSISVDQGIADWLLMAIERTTDDKRKTLAETRERLLNRREKLLRRSELLYDDRLEGRISASRYDDREAANRRELKQVEEKIETLSPDTLIDPLDYARGIIELGQSAESLFVEAAVDEKRDLLQRVLSNCTLMKSQIYPEFAKPFDVIAVANAAWRGGGGSGGGSDRMCSCWHPVANSNLVILCGKPG